MLVGIGAAGLRGVDDGDGLGYARHAVGQVMVGDDEVEAERFGFLGRGKGANACVDRDDEADARGGGFGQAHILDAVALADAMRNVVADLGGKAGGRAALDGGLEQNGCSGAVHVVVAIDKNGLGAVKGTLDAGDGGGHAEHQARVVQVFEARGEKAAGLILRGDAARRQQRSDGGRAAKLLAQVLGSSLILRCDGPAGLVRGHG